MLEDLGGDDREEGFVAGHGGRGAGDEVAGHTGEEGVFGEHFNDMTGAGFGEVKGRAGEIPGAGGDVVEGVKFVAGGFVRGEEVKVGVAAEIGDEKIAEAPGGREGVATRVRVGGDHSVKPFSGLKSSAKW